MPTTTLGRNATGIRGVSNLVVRLGRGVAARSVTVPLPADAQLTWAAPGGDDTFSGTIQWPDRGIARPDAFTQNMPIRVEDRRTGEIIWQGRIADPGFSGDRSEQEFRIAGVGSGHDLDMISVVKLYVDRDPDRWGDLHLWQAGPMTRGDGTGFVSNVFDALQVPPDYYIEFPWPQGTTMNTGAAQAMTYLTALYAGQDMFTSDGSSASQGPTAPLPEVHGLRFSWITQFASANQVITRAASPDSGSTTDLWTGGWVAGTQQDYDLRASAIGAAWSRGDFTYFTIMQKRSGTTTAAASDGYFRVANIHVLGKRYNRYGINVTDNRNELLAPYEIFEDMLGTILNGRFDPGTIVPDGVLIDQATWWDPTPVSAILNAANEWNNSAWWGVWAPANPDALPRLDYRSWNVTARYTLDDTARVDLAGGAEQWANSALISYLRGNGIPTVTRATVTVPVISRIFGSSGVGVNAVKTRDLSVNLTDRGPMSRAKAVALAGELLGASATDRESGSATVHGPILDDQQGRLVQPWEIRPGWPILVGSTPNNFTSGSPTTFDGESTFRLSRVTYRASDDTATLDFDGGTRRLMKSRPAAAGPKYPYVPWGKRRRRR